MTVWASLAAGLFAVGLLAGCGGKKTAATTSATTSANGCAVISTEPKLAPDNQPKPTTKLDPSKTYLVTMKTNCGSFTFKINQAQSPNASASVVSLVQKGFFDSTVFHRIVPGFIIQGGDPTGTGTGGPGYETVDTPPAGATYTHGVVAMAKTPPEVPGTAGSQFFIATSGNAGLPPDYAIIGKVTEGLDVVDRIGQLGDAQEQPTQIVEIESATVKNS
jgi:peptidyl-prolyl cis-trans isomerase B (cyclophilin B)